PPPGARRARSHPRRTPRTRSRSGCRRRARRLWGPRAPARWPRAESRNRRALDAEVGALHVGRVEELLAGPGLHDGAGLQDIRAVRDLERLVRVLLDEEDGDALRVDL